MSRRKQRTSKRNYKGILVLILMIFLVVACFSLFQRILGYSGDPHPSGWNAKAMHVICPKLSESADAFLIQQGRQSILIDTGVKKDAQTILGMLSQYDVKQLDALILTHYDKDHIGAAAEILKKIPVGKCYMTCGSEKSDEYMNLMDALKENGAEEILLTEACTVQNQDFRYTIYPPLQYSYEKNDDNNRSLIITFEYKGKHLLFPGDAQMMRTNEFLKKQYDENLYDFVKIPHHGRGEKAVKELLEKLQPSLAVITSSDEEPADEEVVKLLEEAGVTLAYPKDGTVILQIEEEDIRFLP